MADIRSQICVRLARPMRAFCARNSRRLRSHYNVVNNSYLGFTFNIFDRIVASRWSMRLPPADRLLEVNARGFSSGMGQKQTSGPQTSNVRFVPNLDIGA